MNKQNKLELITVAKVQDAHGLKGEMFVKPLANDLSWLSSLTHFWIQNTKFPITAIRFHKNGFLVTTLDITDRTQAEKYKGLEFQIPSELLVSKKGETIYLYEIEGFEVSTIESGTIGKIKSFSFNGAQDIIIVSNGEKEIQIPFINEFIVKIDWNKQAIEMKLPEGLVEL